MRDAAVSKFVPLTVTAVPATPLAGETDEIVGAVEAVTVNGEALDAFPDGVVTEIEPVVAVAGTLVTICVAVELVTVALTPLNVTVFCDGVALKPVPYSVTVCPAARRPG